LLFMRWPLTLLVVAATTVACTSSSPAGSTCTSTGGRCVLGGVPCSKQAATSAQDCNPDENPGGAFCCLDVGDAGTTAPADGGDRDALAVGDSSLPACTWPASLDRPDVYTTACIADRTYDICETLDDGGSRCGVNACMADEYAVSCGGPGPAQPPPLPTGCRSVVSGPGGGISGCCPCDP
jgi:hypothetical protein